MKKKDACMHECAYLANKFYAIENEQENEQKSIYVPNDGTCCLFAQKLLYMHVNQILYSYILTTLSRCALAEHIKL